MSVSSYNWHGLRLAHENLPPPTCVFKTTAAARTDTSTGVDGSEYQDSCEVLDRKADLFIELCKQSINPAILSGAGLSTASGIRDYASNNAGTAQQKENRLTYEFIFSCRPTVAHRVFAAMGRAGFLKAKPYNWVQQNHDGLELRAGWPEMSNLIHGQWLDTWEIQKKDNAVVPMSGNLRGDLFEHLIQLEKSMDFCISVGTSHSGLNVDRLVKTSGTRFATQSKGLGLAMLTIQKTPYDHLAGLRIFSKCDDFMMIVAKKLCLNIDLDTDYDSVKRTPISYAPSKRTAIMVKFCRDPNFAPIIANAKASGEPVHHHSPNTTRNDATTSSSAPAAARLMLGDRATPPPPLASLPPEVPPPPVAPVEESAGGGGYVAPVGMEPSSLNVIVGNRHENISSDDGNKHKWTMFVSVTRSDAIEAVTYHLHPTFRPSALKVTSPVAGCVAGTVEYQLTRIGWGTFEVGVEILFRNGKTLVVTHELSFLTAESAALVFSE